MNPRIKALGETALRAEDLGRAREFYTNVIGLDVLQNFEGIAFLKVADDGHPG